MTYPGDESAAIEEYLRAKGFDRYDTASVAYEAAVKIAALTGGNPTNVAANKSSGQTDTKEENK